MCTLFGFESTNNLPLVMPSLLPALKFGPTVYHAAVNSVLSNCHPCLNTSPLPIYVLTFALRKFLRGSKNHPLYEISDA